MNAVWHRNNYVQPDLLKTEMKAELKRERENMGKADNIGGRPAGMPGRMRGIPGLEDQDRADNAWRTLGRLSGYFLREKLLIASVFTVVLVATICSIYAPSLQSRAIDIIASDNEYRLLLEVVSFMFAAYAINSVMNLLMGLCSAHLSQRMVKRMRKELFAKITDLPIGYIDTHSHGDLMSRMTNDLENMAMTVSQSIPSFFSGVLVLTGTAAVMFFFCWQLAFLSMITILLTVFATRFIASSVRKYSRRRQALLGSLNGCVEETITGYHTVVSFNHQKSSIRDFEKISDDLTHVGIRAEIFSGIMGPVMNAIGNISFVIIAACGGVFAINGLISVGLIAAFIIYAKQFSRPVNELAQIYSQLQSAIAAAERVFALFDCRNEEQGGEELNESETIDIRFRDVDFSYEKDHPVLRKFTLDVPAGKKVALVGSTGSGKTTVVNLLLKFYDPDGGEIYLNDQKLSALSRSSVRNCMAIVLQDTEFFEDTIYNNLKFANPSAGDEEIDRVLQLSRCGDLIARLPQGKNTVLSNSGANISQGEKQLLSIARALIADPKILILDEATSNVDTRTEKNIQDAMQEVMKNRTSIVIAHRLSTIRDADEIVVLDHGRIAESGNHFELLMAHGRYYELYKTQYAGFAT